MRYRLVWLVVILPLLAICVSLAYQNRELKQQVKKLTPRPYVTSGLSINGEPRNAIYSVELEQDYSTLGVPSGVDEGMMIISQQPALRIRGADLP